MYHLLWIFFIYAFLGWCTEVSYAALKTGRFVNRGFLNGPVCPVYGFGVVIVLWVLEPLRGNLLLLFLGSVALTSLLEWLTGFVLERLFHQRWWDYSQRFLNIHGRVCLRGFVAFGAMSVLVVRYVHPWVSSLTARLSPHATLILAAVLALLFAADLAATLVTVLGLDKRLRAARELIERRLEERIPRLRGLHAFQMKRLSNAFPGLDFTRYHEEWQRLREKLKHKPTKL